MNISGILIQAKPHFVNDIIEQIKSNNFCEYHHNDELGRIIVTIEGKDTEEEINKLNLIKAIPQIIAADMLYSYSEDELIELRIGIEKTNQVPDWLNDPNIKADQIKYNGDLKRKY